MPSTADHRPWLLRPAEMPPVPSLDVPEQLYTVALHPAPIAGMAYPSTCRTPWQEMYDACSSKQTKSG